MRQASSVYPLSCKGARARQPQVDGTAGRERGEREKGGLVTHTGTSHVEKSWEEDTHGTVCVAECAVLCCCDPFVSRRPTLTDTLVHSAPASKHPPRRRESTRAN